MNLTVEKLIRKMIYAKAGGHEKEYQKAKEDAEYEIYRTERDAKIVSIKKELKKNKPKLPPNYGAPFSGWLDVVVVGVFVFVCSVAALAIVVVFVAGVRCFIKH